MSTIGPNGAGTGRHRLTGELELPESTSLLLQLSSCAPAVVSLISVLTEMKKLSSVEQRFVLHWGEMGTRWGINRTVAQIHALLYLSPKPLHAEEICEALGVARSNVSTSLKELQGWGIVRMVHVLGDKRDHFESLRDVWELFRIILNERKKREIDPTMAVLRDCIAEADKDKETGEYTTARLRELANFFEVSTGWYEQVSKWPTSAVTKLLTLGDKARKLIGLGD